MDMKKTGCFIKNLRKEKGLTQEQLAEILGVAGRTVSRWETASNMPDLSILIQIAEFFGVEVNEILAGERKKSGDEKEIKEALSELADYERLKKEKTAKIVRNSFLITLLVGVFILLVQLVLFKNIILVLGEILILLIGGIMAIVMTVYNGLWSSMAMNENTAKKDLSVSTVMSSIFTVAVSFYVYEMFGNVFKTVVCSLGFFVLTFFVGFAMLRILSLFSNKKSDD